MEKNLPIAYVRYESSHGKTYVYVKTEPAEDGRFSGFKVEDLVLKTEPDRIYMSYKKGRFEYNKNGNYDYSGYILSSVEPLDVKQEFIIELEIKPKQYKIFGEDIPAEMGFRTKPGYVELKPERFKYKFCEIEATNFILDFEDTLEVNKE